MVRSVCLRTESTALGEAATRHSVRPICYQRGLTSSLMQWGGLRASRIFFLTDCADSTIRKKHHARRLSRLHLQRFKRHLAGCGKMDSAT